MAVYSERFLLGLQKKVTTFKSQETYLTFYYEKDYDTAGKTRPEMTPVGEYLFYNGFSLDGSVNEASPLQAFGKTFSNQRLQLSADTKFSVHGLYTQESDLGWLAPGHYPLLVFVDFIDEDPDPAGTHNDLDTTHRCVQTLVIRDARVTSRRIAGQDQGSVSYDVDFVAGQMFRLAHTTMDFTGDPLPTPPTPGTGAVGGSVVLIDAGYGTSFGSTYGA